MQQLLLMPITTDRGAWSVVADMILNVVSLLYITLPIYIVLSKNIDGVLRALSTLLSLLLVGLLVAFLQPDYWGILLEGVQLGFTVLLIIVLAKSTSEVS